MIVSADLLRRMNVPRYALWAGPLTSACQANAITTASRMAAFLANVLHETGNLSRLVESLDYTPDALVQTWPARFSRVDAQRMGRIVGRAAKQEAIAERAYGGRLGNRAEGSGDGWLYRGHGGMQTTGFDNYVRLAKTIGWRQPIAELPGYLETMTGAADSAAIFWRQSGCNELADAGRITDARIRVNGGTNGLGPVLALHARLAAMLGGEAAVKQSVAGASDADRLNDASLARARGG